MLVLPFAKTPSSLRMSNLAKNEVDMKQDIDGTHYVIIRLYWLMKTYNMHIYTF